MKQITRLTWGQFIQQLGRADHDHEHDGDVAHGCLQAAGHQLLRAGGRDQVGTWQQRGGERLWGGEGGDQGGVRGGGGSGRQ